MSDDILLIDKPSGITSFGVIRKLRQELKVKKMGHAGTLDPLATGLLIIGVGEGTKKMKELIGLDKVYEARIRLGVKTKTGDTDGAVIEEMAVPALDWNKVDSAIKSLVGIHELPVSNYSAIKKDGKPHYWYARKGIKLAEPVREMTVYKADLLGFDGKEVVAKFQVGSGTYIRSLAEELGKKLGTLGTISSLRRTKIGEYDVKKARKLTS